MANELNELKALWEASTSAPMQGELALLATLLTSIQNKERIARASPHQLMIMNYSEPGLTKSQRLVLTISNAFQHQPGGLRACRGSTDPTCDTAFPVRTSYPSTGTFPLKEPSFPSLLKTSESQPHSLPVKLYMLLACSEFEHIVSWMPHGRSWKILNKHAFRIHVLPRVMNNSSANLLGFVRLLNVWGFRQFTKTGPDISAFFHEAFLRGQPSLLRAVRPIELSQRSPIHDPRSEPDLYMLPKLPGSSTDDASAVAFKRPSIQLATCARACGGNERRLTPGLIEATFQ